MQSHYTILEVVRAELPKNIHEQFHEISDGPLYCKGCPNLDESTTLTVSNVKRIVFTDQPSSKEETSAIQLLAEKGFDVILNPSLIF